MCDREFVQAMVLATLRAQSLDPVSAVSLAVDALRLFRAEMRVPEPQAA